ncbi:flagellin, partial [bacterium]|nr:flagellin [bacterium]
TNRLESTVANLSVASENLTASESRIRDADFAEETSKFTQNQVLLQAGTSVLAQANFQSQGFLSLLG